MLTELCHIDLITILSKLGIKWANVNALSHTNSSPNIQLTLNLHVHVTLQLIETLFI